MRLCRRRFLAGGAATATVLLLSRTTRAQNRAATLRFIPLADVKTIDPIWTTAYQTRNHGYMIYDTLFAQDARLQVRPQMVDRYTTSRDRMKWTFTLRDGLKFHDNQPVTAEDCVASLQRWAKKDPFGKLLMAATAKLQPVDRKTFSLDLHDRFGPVLDALGKPSSNVPFIMPARIAAISENEQIKEAIGSGPFRFVKDEWQPGHQLVYVRNEHYVPRSDPPSGAAGGKRAYVDRVVWLYIPDPATAAAALEAGEVDYWERPPLDFVARLEKNPALTVFANDPLGNHGMLRPNHLHPPFNNKKARQALLWMVDQQMYLQAAIGQSRFYRQCMSHFPCASTPPESKQGTPRQDLDRARRLMAEAQYDGRPVVLLQPTDLPYVQGATLVTAELLGKIGVKVDLQSSDWSSIIARRMKKEPPQQGGWNIVHTSFVSPDVINPAVHAGLSGACDKAIFGWACSEQLEKLRTEWLRATDPARRRELTEQIQAVAFDEVPYVPFGQFVMPSVYRKHLRGVLQFPCHILWNIQT